MALRVWLPFNGDLTQQGLDDIDLTLSSTSFENGKLGKCIRLGYSNNFTVSSMVNSKQMTITLWCKVNTAASTNYLHAIGWQSTNGTQTHTSRQEFYDGCTHTGFQYINGGLSNISVSVGSWNHYAFTIDYTSGKSQVYVNGTLQKTGTNADTTHYVNGIFYIGNSGLDISMNDLRIYDDVLPPLMISEISKGLVLHLPLFNYVANLADTTREIIPAQNGSVALIDNGVQITGEDVDTFFSIPLAQTLTSGKKYTLSFECSGLNDDEVLIFGVDGPNSGNELKIKNGINKITFMPVNNITSSLLLDDIYRNNYPQVSLTRFKIDEGSRATEWFFSSNDSLYDLLIDNKEYDVSGYKHNGVKNGSMKNSGDTKRYSTSTLFRSQTANIVVSNLNTIGFSDSYTFSWWAKVTTFSGKMMWGFADGNRLNAIYNGNVLNTGDGTGNPIYTPGTTTQITPPSVDKWHHYVITGNGSNNYLYVDGELYGQSSAYKPINGSTIYINGYGGSSSYAYNDLLISDFRLYAIALSANQVSALYKTPVVFSYNGSLMTQSEVEE